jgi:dipeptidyl aminopeptidase/acylaminoacyl peptidase
MNRRHASVLLLLLLIGACATALDRKPEPRAAQPATKRPLELTDLYRVAGVSGPSVSPDGEWVVFAVRRTDVEAGKAWSELWLQHRGTGELRQLTEAGFADHDADFAPDGRHVRFLSNRGGSTQLWQVPRKGGRPRALTDFPWDLAEPAWSPDGRWIAVTANVWIDLGADAAAHAERSKLAAAGKLSVHVAEELLYRHWTSWKDGQTNHILLLDAKTGALVRDLTPGKYESPVFSLSGDRGFCFSPDGEYLYFASNRERDQARSTNSDVWRVSTSGGEPVCLTEANDGWDGAPLVSPDGRSLAYVSQEQAGYESDLRRLALMDLSSGSVRYLTSRSGFDDMVGDMRWSSDGAALYFSAEVSGRTPLFRCDVGSGKIDAVLEHGLIDAWELAPSDGAPAELVFVARRVSEPPELYAATLDGGAHRRLTRFNAALERELDLRPAEELWVQGDGDYKVHVFVVKPSGFDPTKRYPLILNVHGGPQSQWSDAWRGDWQVYPAKGYVVAFANPTGSTGYGQAFVDGIACDWGGRVYRDLMKVTDHLAALPYVDPERMGAMGWSYGGYMMMWMQGQTDRFACQAAMMGLYDLRSFYGATEELWFPIKDLCGSPWSSPEYERWSPSNHVANFKTPALVLTGELDFRVPYTQSLQYFTALQERGVPSRLVVFPKAGHWPGWQEMMYYYAQHLDWFQRYLGGGGTSFDLERWALEGRIPLVED